MPSNLKLNLGDSCKRLFDPGSNVSITSARTAGLPIFIALALSLLPAFGALADWRDDMGRFRIGIVSDKPVAKAVSDAEPFRLSVEEKLGLPVEILPMANLSRLADAHADGRVEYAVYPATTYAAVQVNCECVEPLVVARAHDKTAATRFIVIGRTKDARLKPSDLAGKKIWLLTGDEAVGQQFAIHGLKKDGAAIGDGSTSFLTADYPLSAIERFAADEGDALLGWSSLQGDVATGYSRGTLKRLAEISGGSASRYYAIWESDPLPHRTHAVRKNLDGEAKKLLRDLLGRMFEDDPVAYDAIEPVYGGGFQIAPESAYGAALEFINSLVKSQDALEGSEASGARDREPASEDGDKAGGDGSG